MKTEGNEPINVIVDERNLLTTGLTKREYFAAMAMQGMCANHNTFNNSANEIAEMSLDQADALIEALNDEKEKP